MHVRYPRAAVAAEPSPSVWSVADVLPTPRAGTAIQRPLVLWASPALSIQDGRLVGVRRAGPVVQVAFIRSGESRFRWLAPEAVLTEFQAATWAKNSRFSSEH